MDTTIQTKVTSIDLQKRIKQHLEELALATDQARASEEMIRYFDFCSRFHQYSASNIWLILFACPSASMVAGFNKWRSMNRYVKKGEKAIWILAPILYKESDSTGKEIDHLYGFKTVPVFDIGQTDGEPLPEPPNWKSLSRNNELNERLVAFADTRGIKVKFTKLFGQTQGTSSGREIEIDISAGTKTIIHEICHSLLHFDDVSHQSRQIMELQAEATGYVVAKHFGIDGLHSANYLALFGIDSKDIFRNIEIVRKVASEIICGIEQQTFLSY